MKPFGPKKTSGDNKGPADKADIDDVMQDDAVADDDAGGADEAEDEFADEVSAPRKGRGALGVVSVLALLAVIGGGGAMVMTGGDMQALKGLVGLSSDEQVPAAVSQDVASPDPVSAPADGVVSDVEDPFAAEAERMSQAMPPAPPMPGADVVTGGATDAVTGEADVLPEFDADGAVSPGVPGSIVDPLSGMPDGALSADAVHDDVAPVAEDALQAAQDMDLAGPPVADDLSVPVQSPAVSQDGEGIAPEGEVPASAPAPDAAVPDAAVAADGESAPAEHAMDATQEASADEADLDVADSTVPKEVVERDMATTAMPDVAEAASTEQAPPAVAEPALPMAEPSVAEKALVDNASKLEKLAPPPVAPTVLPPAPKVTPAPIRPLPDQYFIIRKDTTDSTAETRMKAANRALAGGNAAAAVEMYDRLLGESPRNEKVLMGRAVALQKSGQNTAALAAYEDVLRSNPKNLDALTNMLGLLRRQSPGLALDKLKALYETYPFNAAIAAQLGTAYGDAGRYDDGLRLLDQALSMAPSNGMYMFNKAVLFDRMGRAPEAAAMYRAALDVYYRDGKKQSIPVEAIRNRLSVLQ